MADPTSPRRHDESITWADYRAEIATVSHGVAAAVTAGGARWCSSLLRNRRRRVLLWVLISAVAAGWNYSSPGATDRGTYIAVGALTVGLVEIAAAIAWRVGKTAWRGTKFTVHAVRSRATS